jgi:colanic acid/amylovoran biosynthesis glycosyltransferase
MHSTHATTDRSAQPLHVGVFRLQMFKPSEPFIAEQVAALPTFKRTLIGRNVLGTPDTRINHIACDMLGKPASLMLAALGYSPALLRQVKAAELALVHAHFAVDGLVAQSFSDRLKLPLVTTLHGFDVTTTMRDFMRSKRPALMRYALLHKRLQQRGDLFLAVSDFIANQAQAAGFPSHRIVRHYMGIDTARFTPMPPSAPETGEVRLLHVARLVEKKGTVHLLTALANLRSKHPQARLEIIGDGPLKTALQAQASALGLHDMVRFTGSVPHSTITARMRDSHIFVLPSVTASNGDSEGLPIVLLEAAACGLPVVSTWHAGIPEAVVHEQTGLLTREHDVSALTDALDALLSSPTLRAQLGQQARTHMCKHFDIATQGHALEAIYRRVLG